MIDMAFYWRSPYQSRGGVDTIDTEDGIDIAPRSARLSYSATTKQNGSAFSESVSPQDWFDSSLPCAKNRSPTVFRRAGTQIKGILKTSQDRHSKRIQDKLYRSSEAIDVSSRQADDLKKEKKKVTFGSGGDFECPSPRAEFQSNRSTSAHQLRVHLTLPVNELTRQNLKKLLGLTPNAALPPVSGKSLLSKSDRPRTTTSAICRHVVDLKCANCTQDNEQRMSTKLKKKEPLLPHGIDNPERPLTPEYVNYKNTLISNTDTDRSLSIGYTRSSTQLSDSKEPRKLERHWTNSFIKSTDRKKQQLSRHVPGRYPFSAGSTPRQFADLLQKVDRKIMAQQSLKVNNPVKLQVTGDGKSTDTSSPRQQDTSPQAPGQDVKGAVGYKIPATAIQHQPGTVHRKVAPGSASLRLKYGSAGLEGRSELYMDKTQQILSWLKDVKQKDGYTPRHARMYAKESQSTH